MPNKQLSPDQLSEFLNNVLPPNSNRVNQQDNAPEMVQVAQLMTDPNTYQLSSVSRQMIHDRMLSEVSTLRAKGHYTKIIPFGAGVIRLVAGIILVLFLSVGVLASEQGQPLYAVKSAFGLGNSDGNDSIVITTLPVTETETLDATATSSPTNTLEPTVIEPTATLIASNTPVPTATREQSADQGIIATEQPESDIITVDGQLWYVNTTTNAFVREEPSTESDALTTLAPSTAVVVIGYTVDNEWAQILLDSGDFGWISFPLLSETPPAPPPNNNDNNGGGNGNGGGNNGGGNNDDNDGRPPRPPRDPNNPPPRNGNGGNGN